MFVVGCHRSGTSLVANVLAHLLPESFHHDQLLAPALDNPGGFFESRALVSANDRLLASIGATWDQPPLLPLQWNKSQHWPLIMQLREEFSSLSSERLWFDKDPRLSITASAYQHILLRRIPITAVIRDPLEVAQSLYSRDGLMIEQGLLLWFLYNFHLAFQLLPSDLVVCLQDFQSDSVPTEMSLCWNSFINACFQCSLPENSVETVTHSVIQPAYFRSTSTRAVGVSPELLECAQGLYRSLQAAPFADRSVVMRELFGSIPSAVLTLLVSSGWQGWFPQHVDPIIASNLRACERDLSAVQGSTCWRITAPIRWIKNSVS